LRQYPNQKCIFHLPPSTYSMTMKRARRRPDFLSTLLPLSSPSTKTTVFTLVSMIVASALFVGLESPYFISNYLLATRAVKGHAVEDEHDNSNRSHIERPSQSQPLHEGGRNLEDITTNISPPERNTANVQTASTTLQSQQDHLPPCTIAAYTQHNITNAWGTGSQQPTILRDIWTSPDPKWSTEQSFLEHYGHIPYYIKDRFVQIRDEECVAQFQDLWSYIQAPAISSAAQQHRRSLLTFTNDLENPALFGEDRRKLGYSVPPQVRHINSFAILSTLTRSQSHNMHRHGESWIAQAAGTKLWWFLPPSAPRPQKVNACGYLDGTVQPPPGATTCLQTPGDVIWFPKDWYHATCSLTDWNIAIGAQRGVRLRQEFQTLPRVVDNWNRSAVQETLQRCSGEDKTL